MTRLFRSLIPAVVLAIAAGCGVAVLAGTLVAPHLEGAAPPAACLAADERPPAPAAGMVLIPGGRFKMGSEDFRAEEAPIREVTVEPFWIDSHDVTNAQFARFVADTGYVTVSERTPPVTRDTQAMAPGRPANVAGSWVFVQPAEIRNLEGYRPMVEIRPRCQLASPRGSRQRS